MSDDIPTASATTDAALPAAARGADPASRTLATPAERALAEAEARRRTRRSESQPPETGGRTGPEPVRYGDWEKNGLICDF